MVQEFGWDVSFAVLTACALLVVGIMWLIGKDEKVLMRAREEKRLAAEAAAADGTASES